MKLAAVFFSVVLLGVFALVGGAPANPGPAEGGYSLRFDPTVTLGQIISAILLAAVVIGGYVKLVTRIHLLEFKVDLIWTRTVENDRKEE